MKAFHDKQETKESKDITTIARTAKILERMGWQVFDIKKDSTNGPDLTIAKNGRSFRVEVKKVLMSKKSCAVKPVQRSAKQCDAIALLLPNDILILQPMYEHAKLCSASGQRSLTNLVRLNT